MKRKDLSRFMPPDAVILAKVPTTRKPHHVPITTKPHVPRSTEIRLQTKRRTGTSFVG